MNLIHALGKVKSPIKPSDLKPFLDIHSSMQSKESLANAILEKFNHPMSPAVLVQRIEQIPIYTNTCWNYLKTYTLSRYTRQSNFIQPVRVGHSWYKRYFNLKRQAKFIEICHSIGLDPYHVHPQLRLMGWQKAHVNATKPDRTKNYELDKQGMLKQQVREKRLKDTRRMKSPLEGRTE